MKKERKVEFAFLILTLSILLCVSVLADEKVDKGYSCLSGKVKTKCSSLSFEEQAFSLMAMAYDTGTQSECKSAIFEKSNNQECWPKTGCKVRDTALAVLALQWAGVDTNKAENWLKNQTRFPTELTWYLEIDAKEATSCKVSYDSGNYTINMAADKKLSGSAGSCLSLSSGNYWLQIKSDCLNKNFKVSCDKDFVSALIYQKTGSDVWHVSSATQASSASGTTENKLESYCFKQNNNCDYEGSLWATLALQKNNNLNAYLPYIIALADDNSKFSPDSFLYKLTGADDYLVNLGLDQRTEGFWDFSSSYGRNYDTALSIYSLQGSSTDQGEKAKTWALSIQGSDGCWASIRDTAFFLFAGWPKDAARATVSDDNCEDFDHFCLSRVECADATGDVLDNFACLSGKICCSKNLVEKTCSDKDGIICKTDEICVDGDLVTSADSSRCCLGTECKVEEDPECIQKGDQCRSECIEDAEVSNNLDCGSDTEVCCQIKPEPAPSRWWIWVLIILIVLVVLAIIFRNNLRLWMFKIKGGFSKGPVTQTRPGFPPSAPARPMLRPAMMTQRPMMPRPAPARIPPQKKEKSKLDSELEETLKKLKDMSK